VISERRDAVAVPAHGSAILMMFTELRDTSEAAITAASIRAARKYDKQGLTPALKTGLTRPQKSGIVNFDV
jgi:hypothetical protein